MTIQSPILAPVVALILWTLVMWGWLYVRRIPAMQRAGIDAKTLVGGTGADLRQRLDTKAGWPADNYNHLLEQPTIFYATAMVLALTGWGGGLNLTLAWAYVALRIAHSMVQVTTNRVIVRFTLFALATLVLVMLAVHAAIAVF